MKTPFLLILVLIVASAWAETFHWKPKNTQDLTWSNALNWDLNKVPTIGDDVFILSSDNPSYAKVLVNSAAQCNTLQMDNAVINGTGAQGSLTIVSTLGFSGSINFLPLTVGSFNFNCGNDTTCQLNGVTLNITSNIFNVTQDIVLNLSTQASHVNVNQFSLAENVVVSLNTLNDMSILHNSSLSLIQADKMDISGIFDLTNVATYHNISSLLTNITILRSKSFETTNNISDHFIGVPQVISMGQVLGNYSVLPFNSTDINLVNVAPVTLINVTGGANLTLSMMAYFTNSLPRIPAANQSVEFYLLNDDNTLGDFIVANTTGINGVLLAPLEKSIYRVVSQTLTRTRVRAQLPQCYSGACHLDFTVPLTPVYTLKAGAIIGIAVGILIAVMSVAVCVWLAGKWKDRNHYDLIE